MRKILGFSSGRTQNPPVLWLTESACSCPEQPLSATHGRQRYNTLDFANKVVCHETAGFIGFFLPLKGAALHWMPPAKAAPPPLETTAKGTLSPLDSPANRALSPLLETPSQRNCHPFGISARFEMSTHKWKIVCGHSFQNGKMETQCFISSITHRTEFRIIHSPKRLALVEFAVQSRVKELLEE